MNKTHFKNTEGAKAPFLTLVSLSVFFFFTGCEETKEMRVYQEPIPQPKAMKMPSMATQGNRPEYIYKAPKDWASTQGDAMRLLSLGTPAGNDIAVTFLGGSGGNLEGNLTRWARQIDLSLNAEQMTSLIESATPIQRQDGVQGKVYNFTPFVSDRGKAQEVSRSIWATIYNEPNGVLFVKVIGPAQAIETDLNDLTTFAKSLTLKSHE